MGMNRRKFFKTSAVGISVPSILLSSQGKINMNNPIVLSTWKHGMSANDAAWEILKDEGSAWFLTPNKGEEGRSLMDVFTNTFDEPCNDFYFNSVHYCKIPTKVCILKQYVRKYCEDHQIIEKGCDINSLDCEYMMK